ncbi:MAG TPA: TlpA disulfide reductase family protein [Verrucomicrobiae bacterium]|jgi:thiol-disulfide isomerase/thioredoxin
MKNVKTVGIVLAVGAIYFAIALLVKGAPVVAGQTEVAPEWSLKDVDGKTVRSTDFKGKVVILDFWATWCGPCRAEIPGFIGLQKQYAKQGLVVIGASVDEGGADVVKSFAQELGMNYPIVLADEKTQQAFGGIEAVPTAFIIDREGQIVKEHLGFADKDEFEKEIKPLLNP